MLLQKPFYQTACGNGGIYKNLQQKSASDNEFINKIKCNEGKKILKPDLSLNKSGLITRSSCNRKPLLVTYK